MSSEPTFASVYDGRLSAFVEQRLAADERARPAGITPEWTSRPGAGPDHAYILVGDERSTVAKVHPSAAAYVTSHSPARGDREIAAHRRTLARFNRELAREPIGLPHARRACALAVADIACIWAGHPDFKMSWAHFAALDEDAPFTPDDRLVHPTGMQIITGTSTV